MKKLILLFVVVSFYATSTFSQTAAQDAAFVSNWKFPIAYWFPKGISVPSVGVENYPSPQAIADSIPDFDPKGAVFSQVWAGLTKQGDSGAGYPVAKQNGNPLSAKGITDFNGFFKVVYDQYNIYILLQYYDDVIDGREVVELMWAPYFSIPAIETLPTVISTGNIAVQASHGRYSQFGGNKAAFTSKGYKDACILDFSATGLGSFNANGTNAVLTNNISYVNKTTLGSHTVQAIYTIGFQTLTGNAYASALNARPTFDHKTWRTINGGKGISFDIKVADTDPDDQLNTAVPAVEQPGEYWWSSTHNDGWCETYYSGFIGLPVLTAVNPVFATKPIIFGTVTGTQIELTQDANVEVFNSIGKRVVSLNNTNRVDLTNLQKGVYVIRANNETMKFSR